MARTTYEKQVQRILQDKSPAKRTALTRAELELSIAKISKQLLGPLSNVERLLLLADRQEMRKQLAAAE